MMYNIKKQIDREKPSKIITVGDKVSQDLTNNSIQPDLLIVDNKIMREAITPIIATADQIIQVKNPPGTISDEAWSAVINATRSMQRTKIVVDGEEDLLALPAVIGAPERSFIFYGQPHEGVVLMIVTEELKKKIRKIINEMNDIS
jgi:uncharacterized protein (UPF0218 family)